MRQKMILSSLAGFVLFGLRGCATTSKAPEEDSEGGVSIGRPR